MSLISAKVTPDDGEPYVAAAGSRDVLVWEKTLRGNMSRLADNTTMTDVYAVIYVAARRLGKFAGTLPDFEDTNELEVMSGDDVDPTQPAL